MSLDVLMVSATMIKDRTSIHDNLDAKLIYPEIKIAQDMYIHPLLGTALYDKILSDISGNNLTGNYKILMDRYIVDCLIHYVLKDLVTSVSFQIWNKGVLRKQGENTELPSMSDLVSISNAYKQKAEWYGERLLNYLKENASSMFPEYLNPGSGIDAIHPSHNAFSMPVFLDDDYDCDRRTFEEKYQGNNPRC